MLALIVVVRWPGLELVAVAVAAVAAVVAVVIVVVMAAGLAAMSGMICVFLDLRGARLPPEHATISQVASPADP